MRSCRLACYVPDKMVLPHLACSTIELVIRKEKQNEQILLTGVFLAFHPLFFTRLFGDWSLLRRRTSDHLCNLAGPASALSCLPADLLPRS